MAAVMRHFRPRLSEPHPLEFPLRLLIDPERTSVRTATRPGGGLPQERSAFRVHPEDALPVGLQEGTVALVSSAVGSLRASTILDDGVQPGTASLPVHLGPLLQPAGWATSPSPSPTISCPAGVAAAGVRAEPARHAVALAGGAFAAAVEARLACGRTPVSRYPPAELGQAPPGVLRVLIGGGEVARGVPWWEVAAQAPPAPRWGVAVLDLSTGPEPLLALRALRWAGWIVRTCGGPWLPEPVQRLVEPHLMVECGNDREAGLWVGSPSPLPTAAAPPATLVLEPGGSLGLAAPVSADPAVLSAFLLGRRSPRGTLRHLVIGLAPGRSLVLIGDPLGDPATDPERGIAQLVCEDRVGGWAQVWRVGPGQVLGVAALLPPDAIDDIEAIWRADLDPTLLSHRVPVW